MGVIAPNDLWLEASYGVLAGLQGFGKQATALAGYTFGTAPTPYAWGFSVPAYAGYRYMSRPNWSASDGNSFHEDMHMLGLGARAVWTRRYETNAIEIGLDAGAFIAFSWREPQSPYYSEDKTIFVAQAFLFVGWVVGSGASNDR